MTPISFPSENHFQGINEDLQHYSAAFDTSASFTMNPLSSHPPRTPRTSQKGEQESRKIVQRMDMDEEERRVRKEDVWREVFLTSYGRDKAFVGGLFLLNLILRRWMVESDSVFYSCVSTVPWASCYFSEDIRRVSERVEVDSIRTVDDEVGVCCQLNRC